MSRRPVRRLILVAAGVLLVAVVVAAFLLATRPEPRTAVVERGSLEATVETVGRLVPRNPITVRSTVSGRVQLVAVSPVTWLKKATSSPSSTLSRSRKRSAERRIRWPRPRLR